MALQRNAAALPSLMPAKVHTLLYAFVVVLMGFELVAFAVFVEVFSISEGLPPEDPRLNRAFRYITGLVAGGALVQGGPGTLDRKRR